VASVELLLRITVGVEVTGASLLILKYDTVGKARATDAHNTILPIIHAIRGFFVMIFSF
jgi:hypothetical protein